MGNWRRVQIVGTCEESDVANLRREITRDFMDPKWNCLCNGGICGLPEWSGVNINATGNLAERDYSPEDVAETLNDFLAVAPTLRVKVHCGGDYESDECIATVSTDGGNAIVGPAEIKTIPTISDQQMNDNFFKQLRQPRL